MTKLQQIIGHLTHAIQNYGAQSKRRSVVKSALIAVVKRHPDWEDAGFDEHFMANRGASLMAAYYRPGQLPDAMALARAWSNQFFWQPATKQSAQAHCLPIAQDFVYVLSSEAGHSVQPYVQPQQMASLG